MLPTLRWRGSLRKVKVYLTRPTSRSCCTRRWNASARARGNTLLQRERENVRIAALSPDHNLRQPGIAGAVCGADHNDMLAGGDVLQLNPEALPRRIDHP